MEIMDIVISFLFLSTMLVFILIWRTNIQYRFSIRAIDIVYSQDNWRELRLKYLDDGYTIWEILNPLLWTFDQLYPGLSELESKDD